MEVIEDESEGSLMIYLNQLLKGLIVAIIGYVVSGVFFILQLGI